MSVHNLSASWFSPLLAAMTICILSAALQLYWGGQDRLGQFHADRLWATGNLGTTLFFVGPYGLLAVGAAIAARQHRAMRCLIVTTVLCAIGVLAGWAEHLQYLRTLPGRETQPMLNFLATILLWFSGIIQVAVVTIRSVTGRGVANANSDDPQR